MTTTIRNYRITDLASFDEATESPRDIAGLYFYQLLDCLVDLAYDVSADFRVRPQLYRHLGDTEIAESLAKLNAKYGTELDFLSPVQRSAIYLPIFGSWDGSTPNDSDSFPHLKDDLIHAATAFAERAVDTGIDMLRENVRTAHRPFKDYLTQVQGDSVIFSKNVALKKLTETNSYPVLRNQGVAAVFSVGIAKDAAKDYPYRTNSAEDLLAEQISKQFPSTDKTQHYTRERISNLQRAALRGAEAIATAIDFEEANPKQTIADIDLLILKCYTWGKALVSLSSQMKIPVSMGPVPVPGTTPAAGTQPSAGPAMATSIAAPAGILGYRQ
jgi:hypothetical protein